jgi:hypothetical protein
MAMSATTKPPTVVLAHGAWADGSSWTKVIAALHQTGTTVTAAPIPLTTLADDIAALAPDENETVADVFYRDTPHPQAPQLVRTPTTTCGYPTTHSRVRSLSGRPPTSTRCWPARIG